MAVYTTTRVFPANTLFPSLSRTHAQTHTHTHTHAYTYTLYAAFTFSLLLFLFFFWGWVGGEQVKQNNGWYVWPRLLIYFLVYADPNWYIPEIAGKGKSWVLLCAQKLRSPLLTTQTCKRFFLSHPDCIRNFSSFHTQTALETFLPFTPRLH